jgi:hypothetical protein
LDVYPIECGRIVVLIQYSAEDITNGWKNKHEQNNTSYIMLLPLESMQFCPLFLNHFGGKGTIFEHLFISFDLDLAINLQWNQYSNFLWDVWHSEKKKENKNQNLLTLIGTFEPSIWIVLWNNWKNQLNKPDFSKKFNFVQKKNPDTKIQHGYLLEKRKFTWECGISKCLLVFQTNRECSPKWIRILELKLQNTKQTQIAGLFAIIKWLMWQNF